MACAGGWAGAVYMMNFWYAHDAFDGSTESGSNAHFRLN